MQFPKIAFVICACALVAIGVRAEDNADQAAARALLVSKLFEISGESTPANAASQQPKPVVSNTAPSFSTTTKVIPAVPVEQPVVMRPINQVSLPSPTTKRMMDSETHYRILRTPHQEIESTPMTWTKSAPVANVKNSSTSVRVMSQPTTAVAQPTVTSSPEFAPIVAPALPIGAGKQQKLLDLLAKYKADQISPEDYHRQRAAIINGM